jgi:energy-coupling factor transporter ATP-binding protein EcfA2
VRTEKTFLVYALCSEYEQKTRKVKMECTTGEVLNLSNVYADLQALPDKRKPKGKRYAVATVLMGIFLAKLCREDKPSGIAEWVKLRGAWLVKLLGLKRESMPHHNTYRRILANAIDEEEFEQLVRRRYRHKGKTGYQVVVALDGKVIRGTITTETDEGLCLMAMYLPGEGESIAGRSVAEVCRRVGYLPQDPNALLFSDTVEEELLVTLRNHGRTPQADEVMELLTRLGLGDKASAYPRDLSAGERQRVALGAVLVAKPGALLLDEPTRGLDYAAKRALLELLRGWRDEGMAILLVTHDVELAAEAADRVVLLEQGLVSASGSPREVMAESERFAPQMARVFEGRGVLTVKEVMAVWERKV